MTGTEQVLVLVVLPAFIVAVIWALASIGGPQAKRRYRPGRPYEFTPVWYLANHHGERGGAAPPEGTIPSEVSTGGATGGASDRW